MTLVISSESVSRQKKSFTFLEKQQAEAEWQQNINGKIKPAKEKAENSRHNGQQSADYSDKEESVMLSLHRDPAPPKRMADSLFCLQGVYPGNIVTWNVAFFPRQRLCSPPLSRPEERRQTLDHSHHSDIALRV